LNSASADRNPIIHIIAGPNGAGKTTFAEQYLPGLAECSEFLNADLIAAGLSPYSPERQNLRAGALMLERMRELVADRVTFSFETTLAGRGYRRMIPEWRRAGYLVRLYFLYLPHVQFAADRVRNRVRQGGHDIPEDVIRRRYRRGLGNFFESYCSIVNGWQLYNSATNPPQPIAESEDGSVKILDDEAFQTIKKFAESPS